MLVSILRAKNLLGLLDLIPKKQRRYITRYLRLHRVLMLFFLFGYIVVVLSLWLRLSFISQTFVSTIMFFGAIFVFIGIDVQSRLLKEIQTTLNGLLPVCSFCKKIRDNHGNWNEIEVYISEHSEVRFSHSICPKCGKAHYGDVWHPQKPEKGS